MCWLQVAVPVKDSKSKAAAAKAPATRATSPRQRAAKSERPEQKPPTPPLPKLIDTPDAHQTENPAPINSNSDETNSTVNGNCATSPVVVGNFYEKNAYALELSTVKTKYNTKYKDNG